MNDERFLKDWLADSSDTTADTEAVADEVMASVPLARQRSRWWPLLPSRGHTPIDDNTPIVTGRTKFMLSPIKAITAGAVIFAVGGAFLIAQPFEQQGIVPGAESDGVAATWVSGNIQPAPSCSDGDIEVDIDVIRSRNVECSPQTWTSSDPRLTGEVSRRWSEDTYRMDDGSGSKTVNIDAAYLRNEGGGWTCVNSSLIDGSGSNAVGVTTSVFTHTCIGDGGHDGLSAILVLEPTVGYSEEFVGLIFSGDFPPVPEPPAAE